jgi:hypothetical protein
MLGRYCIAQKFENKYTKECYKIHEGNSRNIGCDFYVYAIYLKAMTVCAHTRLTQRYRMISHALRHAKQNTCKQSLSRVCTPTERRALPCQANIPHDTPGDPPLSIVFLYLLHKMSLLLSGMAAFHFFINFVVTSQSTG